MKTQVVRYHDISCGHRVVGHEGKCRFLHGHNYRVHFHCESEQLDDVGRVIDFSVMKSELCQWLEDKWDHKMLIWHKDPDLDTLEKHFPESIVVVEFNPTAENMAKFLVDYLGQGYLKSLGILLTKVVIEETRKCSASYEKPKIQYTYEEEAKATITGDMPF